MSRTGFERSVVQPTIFDSSANQAGNTLIQQALNLYTCKDGTVVTDPKDCRKQNQNMGFPTLELIEDGTLEVAAVSGKKTAGGSRLS